MKFFCRGIQDGARSVKQERETRICAVEDVLIPAPRFQPQGRTLIPRQKLLYSQFFCPLPDSSRHLRGHFDVGRPWAGMAVLETFFRGVNDHSPALPENVPSRIDIIKHLPEHERIIPEVYPGVEQDQY